MSIGRVITYWRPGIGAGSDASALRLPGKRNEEVNDGPVSEWTADPTLPMVKD
jgi:3-mercaptopyruvate sulfurtransferase SseA